MAFLLFHSGKRGGVVGFQVAEDWGDAEMQVLRLTTPKLENVWGPVLHPSDEDMSLGTPVRSK